MGRPFLLDTDILVDFLRGHTQGVIFVNKNAPKIILSSIVLAELYAGVKGETEERILDNFVSLFQVVPVTPAIAKKGGFYKSYYGKSHGVGLADAIIAATAEAENAELKTLNVKHYPMLKRLKPAYTK
ncbi:MAG: type II toxin-antitoxin system VapC family toxin [Desulfobacteraceae bacterium]|jgi:predicted nucleic acid-binding protein|nr:MAG: type II toxin-antitoxin system VapC family toxin [Desulfobacteraceae bacterium]